MSHGSRNGSRPRRAHPGSRRHARGAAAAALATSSAALAVHCGGLLAGAAGDRAAWLEAVPIWGSVGVFFASVAAFVAVEVLRLADEVRGPELRLRRALQRVRGGDVGFRVSLRRDDLLRGLAHECNELIEWLNANPPRGARLGSDIIEVGHIHDGEDDASRS